MQRLIIPLLFFGVACVRAEPLRVTTWNLNSTIATTATLSAAEEKRLANIAAALKSLNADVILLQEVRDRRSCEKLVSLLQPARYQIAVCSAFVDAPGRAAQQVAILSRKPVTAAWAEPWKAEGAIAPPGGFAFAAIRHGASEVGLYSVQLKNNATTGQFERDTQFNILKRELSAAQLVQHFGSLGAKLTNQPSSLVIAGSLNTSPDEPQFVSENTMRLLQEAGFKNVFGDLPLKDRTTRRGSGKFPSATCDYVLARNADFLAQPRINATELSGHFPVTTDLVFKPAPPGPKIPLLGQPLAHWQLTSLLSVVLALVVASWWLVNRKKIYSPAAISRNGNGFANLLSFPEPGEPFSALPEASEAFDPDGEALPVPSKTPGAAHSQILSLQKQVIAAELRAERATEAMRKGLLPHLARLMKDKLFHGVASQRMHLLQTQQSGARQVTELEQRLAKIQSQWQNRLATYERRIAELEKEIASRDQANRELLADNRQIKEAMAKPQEPVGS